MKKEFKMLLGISGGLLTILFGIVVIQMSVLASAFGTPPPSREETLAFFGVGIFIIILGLIGIIGGVVARKNDRLAGILMLTAGVFFLPIGISNAFTLGKYIWIVPGILLLAGGTAAYRDKNNEEHIS